MAAITIGDFREKYPQYNDLSDEQLAQGLHQKFYSDIPFEEFSSKIGLKSEEKDRYPTLAAAADVPLSFGRGVVSGIKMISDAFGADSSASKALQSADTYLADLMSAQSKKDAAEVSRIMQEAQDKGMLEQVKAGLKALSVAPVDILTNALGTAAPTVVAGLLTTAALPEVAGAALATRAVQAGVGAISGAGTIKSTIYSDVKSALIDQGVPEDQAEKAAQEAQSYNGKNLDSILGGTILGAIASSTGLEQTAAKSLASKILKGAISKEGAKEAAETGVTQFAKGFAKESATEAAQAGQEQLSSNIAAQREGVDVPTMRGVAGAAALEGIAGGILGGGVDVAAGGPKKVTAAIEDEDQKLRDAIELYNQDKNAPGKTPVLLLEDQTGNRLLEFAEQHRDSIPVLGTILDSNSPRDIKIELLKSKIGSQFEFIPNAPVFGEGEVNRLLLEDRSGNRILDFANQNREKIPVLGTILDSDVARNVKIELLRKKLGEGLEFIPNQPASVTGRVALPGQEKGSVKPHEAYNMIVDSGAPLADLNFEKTPGGNLRLLSGSEKVLTAPIRFASEREQNLFVEALRRENDMRQQADYEDMSQGYKAKHKTFMTETLAAAAREVNTPLYPVTLADVGRIDPDLVQKVRVSRQQEGSANVEAPATINELRERGASRDTLTKLSLEQKPITGGGDTIRPEYVEANLGPRPSEPTPTARTEQQLQALELRQVTTGEEAKTTKKKKEEPVAEEAPVETGRVFQRRAERPAYPEIPQAEAPDPQAVENARALINERLGRVRGDKEQGQILSDALQKALDSGEFKPEQMVAAFNAADVTARLLGKTEVDPHTFEFLGRVFSGSTEAFGKRVPPSETVRGLIQFSLDKRAIGERGEAERTAAHEAFHVLQDIFAKYDPQGSKVIKDAFKGARSLDEISPSLLSALKRIKDPDSGTSIYQSIQDNVPQRIFDDLGDNQAQRERELQAYVFEYLDNAMSKNANVTGLGGAFKRLLNFIKNFKERFGNLLQGQGFLSAEDVLGQVSRGERQAGLGEPGARVMKDTMTPEEARDFSVAIKKTGQEGTAKVNSDRFRTIWDSIREFFQPFALINNLEELFQLRNLSVGTTAKSEEFARKMSDIISKGSDKDRQAVYEYLTTRNANPDGIANKKIREAAIQTKKEINSIAKQLVDEGQLSKESFDKYYDQYLPRLYMVNVLNNKGLKTPLGGKSMQEYLYERNNDLTEEERAIMGEIKDPAFLAYVAISRPSRDLAMIKYLNNIFAVGEENGWIAPQTTVEWRGNKMTPYSLKQRADEMLAVLDALKQQDPKQAAVMEKEIIEMLRIADAGIKQIGANMSVHELDGYKQMPIHPRYTNLSGAVLRTPIYNDLVGTFIPIGKTNASLFQRLFADENSKLVQFTQLWKLGKTTLNPPTVFTNMISNGIALNLFGGVPIHKFPLLMNKAITEMANNGKNWNDAQSFGLQGGTMSSAELNAAVNRLRDYQRRSGNDTSLVGMFAGIRSIASGFAEKSAELYQLSETLFKFMKYIHDIEQAGPKPTARQKSNAVNAANDALFDYTLVNPNIRWVRQAPIGLPFITYYYKSLPKLVETAVKTPWRFIPYVAMAYALPMATMAAFDIDEDELEKLRKSMAEYIRDNGSLYILPLRDDKGNIQFVDAGRYFPFSTFVDPLITAFKYGEVEKGAKEMAAPFTPSGPLVTAITALNSGVDPFTNKKIYDDRDTPKAQALSILSYVWNQALPPALNVDLNNMDNSAGALPKIYNSLFVDQTGVDKRGLPKPETAETISRLFGFNITPLDAQKQRALNIMYMQNKIGQSKALMTQLGKDQSMTPEERVMRIRSLADEIRKDTEDLQKYAAETAGVEKVAEKVRKAQ